MIVEVAEFPSESSKPHKIKKAIGTVYFCSCEGFKWRDDCSHVQTYREARKDEVR